MNEKFKAWLSETRDLLKKPSSAQVAAKGLTKILATLDAAAKELQEASQPRRATFAARCSAVMSEADDALKTTDTDRLTASRNAAAELVKDLKGAIAAQKKLDKEVTRFASAHGAFEVDVAEVMGLRGGTIEGTAVKKLLDSVRNLLDNADDKCASAVSKADAAALSDAFGLLDLAKTRLHEAKAAAKSAKVDAKDDLDAMKQWGRLAPQARAALREMRGLPGAESVADELQTRFDAAAAGIKNNDGLWVGHAEAVQQLGDVAAMLAKARKAHEQHIAKTLPKAVADEAGKVQKELVALAEVAPDFVLQMLRDESRALQELGRSDETAAVSRLQALAKQLRAETASQQQDKQAALHAWKRFDGLLESVRDLEVPPPRYAGVERVGESALGDIEDHQWAAAASRLTAAGDELQRLETSYGAAGGNWKAHKAELERIRREAGALVAFPVVGQAANSLREHADETLAALMAGDLKAFDAATVGKPPLKLTAALDKLIKDAKTKGVPVGDADQREVFIKTRSECIERVWRKAQDTCAELQRALDSFEGLGATQRRLLEADWLGQVGQIESDWQERANACGDADTINKLAKQYSAKLRALRDALTSTGADALEPQLRQLAQEDGKRFESNMPDGIGRHLDALQRYGEPVAAKRKALADLVADKGKLNDAQRRTALLNLAGDLRKQLDAAIQADSDKRKDARVQLREKTDALKKLPVSKVYREELQRESSDTLWLIESNDPDLLQTANERLARQAELIKAIETEPKLYEGNKKRLKELGERLGGLRTDLPDTFARLQAKLTQLFQESKHTAPKPMGVRIDALAAEVDEAQTASAKRKREIKQTYDPLLSRVNEVFAPLLAMILAGASAKNDALIDYGKARIAEASALKKTELPVTDVIKPLQALDSRLQIIVNARNREAAIGQVGAELEADQRKVRDMAAQFERELQTFKATSLKQAKVAAKADEDGDTDLAKSLSSVAGAARKIVSPYLDLLSSLPHKQLAANASPDMNRMQADFTRARALLDEATRTAQRLVDTPTMTNVQGPSRDGLRKLLPKWSERCQAYDAALRTVADAMLSAAANDNAAVKKQAQEAAEMVKGLMGTLRSTAFATSFGLLMQPVSGDKSEREKTQRAHLEGREQALRQMRQYRAELTENSLRRLLTDPAQNPFEAPTLLATAGALRVLLKEIELQALDSV